MGSTLSLTSTGEEDRLHVYSSIIETIVKIVDGCKDEKVSILITARDIHPIVLIKSPDGLFGPTYPRTKTK